MAGERLVLVSDHGSTEGSRPKLAAAVEMLTGAPPLLIDARHFLPGGGGRAKVDDGRLRLAVPSEGLVATPAVVLVYEIPPHDRARFAPFQRRLRRSGVVSLGTDVEAWRVATEKDRAVARFAAAGVPQMETVVLARPGVDEAVAAFERLGGDVWARPTIGLGGSDVFHVTDQEQLLAAREHYERRAQRWLVSRDAGNFDGAGRRHQFRIVVLGDRVVRACEHVQADPDAPCNEARGALSTVIPPRDLPPGLAEVAVRATRSTGLPFAGVDVALESGIVVFEVNVHPVIGEPRGLETMALPYVEAHLTGGRGRRRRQSSE